jgi:lambda family phage tail tape measure protein
MATTVDNVTLKVSVDGSTQLDNLGKSLGNIEAATKSAATTLNAFSIRNIAYQIQDIAVQAEMGTNAFRIFTQQAPQLLSAFGTAGAVLGAVAAVTLPLVQYGLKLAGYDARSLTERISDLTSASQQYQKAQVANLTTAEGLRYSFGSLSDEAKKFYEVQQELTKKNAYNELNSSLTELDSKFKIFRQEADKPFRNMGDTLGLGGLGEDLYKWWKRTDLGLTAEQASKIGDAMKDIDKKKPAEAAEALRQINEYINSTVSISPEFKRTWTETIGPILKINEGILELEKNVKAAQEQASAFNTELLRIQNNYSPDINAARRNYNQLTAIELERRQKVAEINAQFNQKELDGVSRTAERKAALLKVDLEAADKAKDFTKSQDEAYRSMVLQTNTKKDQLDLQAKILGLSEEGRLSAFNSYQLEQDLLTSATNYKEALVAIGEQRRKNLIDATQQSSLEKSAADVREKADQNAYSAAERRQRSFIEAQNQIIKGDARRLDLFTQTIGLSDREKKNAEDIFAVNEERVKQLSGLNNIDDLVLRAAKEKEINDIFDARVASIKTQQQANLELQKDFSAGWKTAMANYVDDSANAFKQAQSLFQTMTKGMEDLFVNFAKTGKFEWKNFVASMVEELLRSQVRQLMANLFTMSGGGAGGGGGLFGGKIIPGFLAAGGPVTANKPYIVGEKGPELFLPNQAGTMIPNKDLGSVGSSSTYVTYNINAVDAPSFKAMIARDPSFIYAVAMQGASSIPGRR